jgi:hypothetical protein
MMLIKNLWRHNLPPLRRISSRDSKLQDEVGWCFSDREVTLRVKLVWLPLKDQLLAVITFNCSDVLILLLRIRAITYKMPRLSTIVAKAGRKFLGLGNLLLIFLDEMELPPLSLSYHLGLRVSFAFGELGGLAGVATSFALTRTSLPIGNFPLTYIYLR